jgi:hypothetical protein
LSDSGGTALKIGKRHSECKHLLLAYPETSEGDKGEVGHGRI